MATEGDVTDDLASQAMFSLLLFVLTVSFDFAELLSRISPTRAENVIQYLLITRRVWVIINEDITKRSYCFLKIS